MPPWMLPNLLMNTINKDLKDVIDSVKAYIELDRASGISEFFADARSTQYAVRSTKRGD